MKNRIVDDGLGSSVELLFDTLIKTGFLKKIIPTSIHFHDEPRMFLYMALIKGVKINNYEFTTQNIISHGFSFTSKPLALLKCLSEGIERASISGYNTKSIFYSSYNDLNGPAIDIGMYSSEPMRKQQQIGWIKGRCLTNDISAYIPAHLVYLNYSWKNKEQILSPIISTGASAGFDYDSTVLRGIYEVIERDAFMTIYLNKISAPRIKITTINNAEIKSLDVLLKKYQLELCIFDFTHDLKIPVYVSIIMDRTGRGPAISVGAKCGFNPIDSIIGSIEEAFMARLWLKKRANAFISNNNSLPWWPMSWWPLSMIKKLDFLIKSSPMIPLTRKYIHQNNNLEYILKSLKEKNYDVYLHDNSLPFLKKRRLLSVKVIIPKLQPLYLDVKNKKINKIRLDTVARYFGVKRLRINTIHHPFL